MAEEEKSEEVVEEKKTAAPEAAEESKAPEAAAEPAAEEAAEEKKEKEKPRTAEDIFLELEGGEGTEAPKILKAKGSKNVHNGIVHVSASFNNTIVSVTDATGNVIGWSSAGKMGFRGSRKSTAYAAQLVSQDACRQAMSHGLKQAEVRVKGPGAGRESAVRAVQGLGIDVTMIRDVTPVPHNGCRPKKARRV
ncbi:MAG: 30S ribosomal protein S11 [Verrucomicrobiales bacterium]|nr:30S ribosomal protein S11 [Verrucomicrobiales bacterium]